MSSYDQWRLDRSQRQPAAGDGLTADILWSARQMFDQDTFAARHGAPELTSDPVLAMLAERERLCGLASEALAVAERIEADLTEKASGSEALFCEADALYRQADALDERICETHATSFAGILGQLERIKEAFQFQEDREDLVDTIIAGIKALTAANTGERTGFDEPDKRGFDDSRTPPGYRSAT
jgi:hypothetical protein